MHLPGGNKHNCFWVVFFNPYNTVDLCWSQCSDPTGTSGLVKIQMPAGVHVGDIMKCILFSWIHELLTVQLTHIDTQFQIYQHKSFVENFHTHTQYHGWAMRSWKQLTSYAILSCGAINLSDIYQGLGIIKKKTFPTECNWKFDFSLVIMPVWLQALGMCFSSWCWACFYLIWGKFRKCWYIFCHFIDRFF